ncbi:hypothetical protein E2C01_083101 [Portunus trituberculatus]|uniref:Uncharacterized protein n=1 Tax=Portunus trituberculatus TaxID=210409 RepID=A0A5B7J6W4_PORTR|nr:hypothetical protein [Portunus trituberculatus]
MRQVVYYQCSASVVRKQLDSEVEGAFPPRLPFHLAPLPRAVTEQRPLSSGDFNDINIAK